MAAETEAHMRRLLAEALPALLGEGMPSADLPQRIASTLGLVPVPPPGGDRVAIETWDELRAACEGGKAAQAEMADLQRRLRQLGVEPAVLP